MRKSLLCVIILATLSLLFSGCEKTLVNLPENPLKFDTYSFTNPDNPEDTCRAFDYNGRTYISYANLGKTITKNAVSNCLGFIVQDGVEHQDKWVVRLKAFETDDVLMIYFPYGMMDTPYFYRAIDTKGQALELPEYIAQDSIDDYWK